MCFGRVDLKHALRIPRLRATIRPPRTIASLISTELVVARETASTFTAALEPGAERCEKLPGPRTEDDSSLTMLTPSLRSCPL